jgi:hypothetical protein
MSIFRKLKASKHYAFRLGIENILDKTLGLFLFQYQKKNNMFNWFYNCLRYQVIDNPDAAPKYNYYEFGVASGGSMKIYILALKKFCKDYKQDIKKFHIFGFDSFAGLPEAQEADKRKDWYLGQFKYGKEVVLEMIRDVGFPMENVHLIEGYYEDSLIEERRRECQAFPPAIINMDTDYYSSTMTAFGWVGPLLSSGTLFRFDDIWSFYGHPEKGQIKAIRDFNQMDKGTLTAFPILGLDSYCYIYCRKNFEYA